MNLPDDFDIERLVRRRAELFRPGVTPRRLKEWQQKMLNGKSLPAWLREIDDKEARAEEIRALTVDEVFRSQFRAEQDAPRSSVEILDWGLEHINRLRKARLEAQEATIKSWQILLLFALGILNVTATIIVAVMRVGS